MSTMMAANAPTSQQLRPQAHWKTAAGWLPADQAPGNAPSRPSNISKYCSYQSYSAGRMYLFLPVEHGVLFFHLTVVEKSCVKHNPTSGHCMRFSLHFHLTITASSKKLRCWLRSSCASWRCLPRKSSNSWRRNRNGLDTLEDATHADKTTYDHLSKICLKNI